MAAAAGLILNAFVRIPGHHAAAWQHPSARVEDATDLARIHPINHVGAAYRVRGPLNAPRSPQGWPLLVQAGSSEDGIGFASRYAEAIFTVQQTLESAQAFYADVKRRAAVHGRDPESVKALPGLCAFIGSTEAEARSAQAELDTLAVPLDGPLNPALLQFGGVDLSGFALDEPVPLHRLPDESEIQGSRSRFALIVSIARREQLTTRQLVRRVAGARGHFVFAGTPEQVADLIETWFRRAAADGFNIMPPLYPTHLDRFVDQVVPILQQRGVFHADYEGTTLRDHYGLQRPPGR